MEGKHSKRRGQKYQLEEECLRTRKAKTETHAGGRDDDQPEEDSSRKIGERGASDEAPR